MSKTDACFGELRHSWRTTRIRLASSLKILGRARKPVLKLPFVTRAVTDIIIMLVALPFAKLSYIIYQDHSFDINNSTPLNSLEFWLSGWQVTVGGTAVVVTLLGASGVYEKNRWHGLRKLLVVAAAITAAYVIILSLAGSFPNSFAVDSSIFTFVFLSSLLLMTGSRLWLGIWKRVLTIETSATPTGDYPSGNSNISADDRQRLVLVIGGAGYIGSALLPKLLHDGWRVRLLDLMIFGTEPIEEVLHHSNLEILRADFRDVEHLVSAMQGVTYAVHLGGIVGDLACAIDEELTIDVNVTATKSVAQVARGAGVRRLVFASSCSVYGATDEIVHENSTLDPVSLYARTKVASEQVLLAMKDPYFETIILRFATVFGVSGRPRFDLVVNLLTAKALLNREITVYNGQQWRPLVHVDDVARVIFAFLTRSAQIDSGFPVFNVGSNQENYTILQIAQCINRLIPDASIVCCDSNEDARSYRVCFDKLEKSIWFSAEWTLQAGVRQIIDALRSKGINDYSDPRYSNARFLSEPGNRFLAKPHPSWAREITAAAVRLDAERLGRQR